MRELGLDALVAIGGDGTMASAHRLAGLGLPVVGVPKTIDNDLCHNDRSFGFDSAVAVVAEALGRLETTARSHGRVMIVETMGRYAGWIALEGGLAGAADVILLPERPYALDAVLRHCQAREAREGYTLICIAEGARPVGGGLTVAQTITDSPDPLRLGGVGAVLAQQLQPRLQSEVRATLLGHVQRGGAPTPFDRVLATRFGWAAAELLRQRRYGVMVALQGDTVTQVALAEVAGKNRTVPSDHPLLAAAEGLGISLGGPACAGSWPGRRRPPALYWRMSGRRRAAPHGGLEFNKSPHARLARLLHHRLRPAQRRGDRRHLVDGRGLHAPCRAPHRRGW